MAPKKDSKKDEKKEKKAPEPPELKELREKEKAITKVAAPDRTEHDAALQKINEGMNEINQKLQTVEAEISKKSVGKEEHNAAKAEIRAKLDEYQKQVDELEAERKRLQGGIQDKRNEDRTNRQNLNDMKKKLGFDTEAEINTQIATIEDEMMTGSFSLKEEKDKMAQIADLKKRRPMVQKYNKMEATAGGGGDIGSLRGNLDEVFKSLNEVRDAKKLQHEALQKLNEARQKVMGNVGDLFQKKEALKAENREKIKERKALQDAYNAKYREYQQYQNEVGALRRERARIERKQRDDEWNSRRAAEKAEEGPPPLPYAVDLLDLSNLLGYLKGLLPKEAAEKPEEVKKDFEATKGHMVIMSKGERDEEFFFAPTKRKGPKKGGAKKAKPIVHDLQTLACFDKYKVSAPKSGDDVPQTVKEVEAKVVEYTEKQKEKIAKAEKEKGAKKDADAEAPEAAAAEEA